MESVRTVKRTAGSNPALSATEFIIVYQSVESNFRGCTSLGNYALLLQTYGISHVETVSGARYPVNQKIRLMLGVADRPDLDHPASIIYYKVDDIEKVYEIFKARGVKFIVKPHLVAPMPDYDLWLADFRDSEGNLLALMSEVPRQVA